jgi:hypothetical protein
MTATGQWQDLAAAQQSGGSKLAVAGSEATLRVATPLA